MKVPLLNFVEGPGIPLLNFEGDPGVPLLNFRGVPESRGPGNTFTPCLVVTELNLKCIELLWRSLFRNFPKFSEQTFS